MKKYLYILVVLLCIGCVANSTAEKVYIDVTAANRINISGTFAPERTPSAASPAIEIRWLGAVPGGTLHWNGKDLLFQTDAGTTQSVFSRIARNYCRAEQTGSYQDCYCGHSIRLASVVGRILSIDHETSFSCAGSHLSWRYASFDLGKAGDFIYPRISEFNEEKPIKSTAGKIISLRELFPESEILAALLANHEISEEISKAVAAKELVSQPQSLDEFNEYFANFDSCISDGLFCLEKDYLTRFAFHHLVEEKVAIWISLTPRSHTSHAVQEHIEIVLPISEKLRTPLRLADAKSEGFLMKDASSVVGTSYAEFEFGGAND